MRFSFWPSPANDYSAVSAMGQHVEAAGWDGLWFADHFMPNAEDTSGPTNEAWTTLAALARDVPRVRLGTMVTGNTYRHPAVLAKTAASVDQISGGRVVLGLGSGWQENEHVAYGIEFGTVASRLERLDEACQIIKGLFSQDNTDFAGKYYTLQNAPLAPKPAQANLPLLIGGGGERVTLKITAKYADEWNVWGNVETLTHKMGILDQHCATVGRDPAAIERSAVALLFLTENDAQRDQMKKADIAMPTIIGGPSEVVDIVAAYRDAGVQELLVPDFNLGGSGASSEKLAVIDRFTAEVMPAFR